VQVFVRGRNKPNVKEIRDVKVAGSKGSTTCVFGDDEVELWYPVGYGKQPLYEIEVVAIDDVSAVSTPTDKRVSRHTQHGTMLDSVVKTVAFRRVQVVEKPLVDQDGLSWYFEINNIPIFAGGAQGERHSVLSQN